MPISLACEGVVQLDAPLPSPSGPKARFLPAPLIRARAEALNRRNCLDLARTARQALYGILAFFDVKRPTEPVFASRDSICAESLLGSHPTLYRGLAELVTRGYITREQGRRRARETFGQYSVSRIWLTEKALQLLGLAGQAHARNGGCQEQLATREEVAGQPERSFPQGPSITVRARIQEIELSPNQQLSSKEQPPPEAPRETDQERAGGSRENRIDKKTRLPAELVRLMSLGLSRSRICALMKLAREHGNGGKLGAVVALVWHRIQQFNAKAAFAYLATLVRQRKDFARLLEIQDRFEDRGSASKAVLERLNTKLPMFLERGDGMQVVTRRGKLIGVLRRMGDGGYVECLDDQRVRRTLPVNARLVESWEEGDVVLRRPNHEVCYVPEFAAD